MIKLLLLDRDGVINMNSKDTKSPYYYILKKSDLILKEGVKEAFDKIKKLNIPVFLVTRQRCISKKLITRQEVEEINQHLEVLLNFKFSQILVEEVHETKKQLYESILCSGDLYPDEIYFVDDSLSEIEEAKKLGIKAIHSDNLLKSIYFIVRDIESMEFRKQLIREGWDEDTHGPLPGGSSGVIFEFVLAVFFMLFFYLIWFLEK